jgi:hypothetical protein
MNATTTAHLDDTDVEAFAAALDRIREEIIAERGESDARYIRRVIAVQRTLEAAGRAALLVSLFPPAWTAGTAMLAAAKILDNMEIGHNVLHGQWDWMRDPKIHSTTWEWDALTPAAAWKHTHNDLHHRWTNVLGRDRDVGYTILRMSQDQPWRPDHLAQPLYNAALAPLFEWGIAIFDLEFEAAVLDPGGHLLMGCVGPLGCGMIVVRPVSVCPGRGGGSGCRWSRSRGRSRRRRLRGRCGRSTTGGRSRCRWRSVTGSGNCSPTRSSRPRSG